MKITGFFSNHFWKVLSLRLFGVYSSATLKFIWFAFVYLVLVLVSGKWLGFFPNVGVEYHIPHMLSAIFFDLWRSTSRQMRLNFLMGSKLNGPVSVVLPFSINWMMVSHWKNIYCLGWYLGNYGPVIIYDFSCLIASAKTVPIMPPSTKFITFMFVVWIIFN